MKISLITATFNSTRTIGDALDSVVRQNVGGEVEHIIIDGASTDGTVAEVAKLLNDGCWEEVSQTSDIRSQRSTYRLGNRTTIILSEKDTGMYDAMNKGVQMATGDIVGLLNSDDMLAVPDVLETIVRAFDDPAVEAVYGDLVFVDASDMSRVCRVWHSGVFSLAKLKRGWFPAHPTLYLRRSVYEKYGLFDPSFGSASDVEFMMRIFSRGLTARYYSKVFIRMRLGGISTRVSNVWKQSRSVIRGMKKNGIRVSPLFWPAKIVSRIGQIARGVVFK